MRNSHYPSEFMEQLRYKNDIVSTISRYIKLTRRGSNYWACCPFHNEKTPSLSIKEDGQFFKCFGCGVSGDAITFVMMYENVDFPTAVEILAKNAGMEVPTIAQPDDVIKKKKQKDKCLEILKVTADFYVSQLHTEQGTVYKQYAQNRHISDEAMRVFKVGASVDYHASIRHLRSLGYSKQDLVESGVASIGEKGDIYDHQGSRLTFPIMNSYGEVIGFTSRDITGNSRAKYKNTPQTMLFNKSQIIYGINNLRELKKANELGYVLIVEGQIDVISCYSHGYKNTVACMGTAFTQYHAKEILRLTDKVILCLDNDGAGQNATYKAIEILRQVGLNVKVCRLHDAKDPDEFISKFGKSGFNEIISQSKDCIEYIIDDLQKNYDLSKNDEKSKYVTSCLSYIGRLSSSAEREIYLIYLRDITKIPVEILRDSISDPKALVPTSPVEVSEKPLSNTEQSGKQYLLACLLHKKSFADISDFEYLFADADEYSEVFEYIRNIARKGRELSITAIFDEFEVDKDGLWDKLINYDFNGRDTAVYYNECLANIGKDYLKSKKSMLLDELKSCKDDQSMVETLQKIKEIDEKIKSLTKRL